jgi:hypothetical protein
MSKVDELARLHDLFVRGAVTSEEFAAMKAKIIAEPPESRIRDKLENTHQATASTTRKYIAFITGAICIGWIVTGVVEAVIGFRQYELEKSRALGAGLIVAYVLPTGLVARFLIRRKRNVIVGVCVLVGDTILLTAAALLFHFGD